MSPPPHPILGFQGRENYSAWQQQVAYHYHVRMEQSQNQEQHPLKDQLARYINKPGQR